MKNFKLYPRLFVLLALCFIPATIIGALSHELGHYVVCKYYGGHPILHYASVSNGNKQNDFSQELKKRYEEDKEKIEAPSPSDEKEFFLEYREEISKKLKYAMVYTWLGGPIQTMLTGTLGAVILWLQRNRIKSFGMKTANWFWIIISFFWSRQLANFLINIINYTSHCKYKGKGDEARISRFLGLPVLTLDAVTGIIGLMVLIWIVFFVIPKQHRFNFILAGLIGSVLGWVVWMEWLGPIILP